MPRPPKRPPGAARLIRGVAVICVLSYVWAIPWAFMPWVTGNHVLLNSMSAALGDSTARTIGNTLAVLFLPGAAILAIGACIIPASSHERAATHSTAGSGPEADPSPRRTASTR